MAIHRLEFTELEGLLRQSRSSWLNVLAPDVGKAFVVAITRDGCAVCERHKPKLEKLAEELNSKHGKNVAFTTVHINWREDFNDESQRSKEVMHHYFYPTDLVLVRTRDMGVVEYYRATAPRLSDLKRSILSAAKAAEYLAKEKR